MGNGKTAVVAKKAVVKKSVKSETEGPKKVYLVQYELTGSGDPIKEFATLDGAKKWVANVYQSEYHDDDNGDEIDLSSFKIYEGYLIGKPKIEIVFTK